MSDVSEMLSEFNHFHTEIVMVDYFFIVVYINVYVIYKTHICGIFFIMYSSLNIKNPLLCVKIFIWFQ